MLKRSALPKMTSAKMLSTGNSQTCPWNVILCKHNIFVNFYKSRIVILCEINVDLSFPWMVVFCECRFVIFVNVDLSTKNMWHMILPPCRFAMICHLRTKLIFLKNERPKMLFDRDTIRSSLILKRRAWPSKMLNQDAWPISCSPFLRGFSTCTVDVPKFCCPLLKYTLCSFYLFSYIHFCSTSPGRISLLSSWKRNGTREEKHKCPCEFWKWDSWKST